MHHDDPAALNARDLSRELDWFEALLAARLQAHFGPDATAAAASAPGSDATPRRGVIDLPAPPPLGEPGAAPSPYAALLARCGASTTERLALLLALVPALRPRLLDPFFIRNASFDKPFAEFGGQRDGAGAVFVPTGETLAFLLAGEDLAARFALLALFDRDHWFWHVQVLQPGDADLPPLQRPLRPTPDLLGGLTSGRVPRPDLGASFPAQALRTRLTWDDLVLHPGTLAQVREVEHWLRHGRTLLDDWGMARMLRPGHRALFHGPPGTGKTMTAALLGHASGREVYRIDLSLVVSKYIGETEKNLARVFDAAQHQGWLLFFDEADALFGKRGEARDAHDRYANQEVAYLLQRIESFDGVAILASNLREHIDPAFGRRFESIVYFPLPRPEERLRLWRQAVPAAVELDPAIDLAQLAARHALSGGAIMNVVRHACLAAAVDAAEQAGPEGARPRISAEALQRGLRRELAKDGREG